MVTELSTVDFVKQIAEKCGWKGTKEKKDREFLHNLKSAMEEWDNIPNKKTLESAQGIMRVYLGHNHIIFVNIREPKSIESFMQLIMEEGYLPIKILMESGKKSNEVDSIAQEIKSIKYDRVYINNGSLDDLKEKAKDFVEEITNAR